MNIASLIGGIASLAWVAVLGIAAFVIVQASRQRPIKGGVSIIIISVVVAIILGTVSAGLVFINPQERGVVISAVSGKGYREPALQPGLRWVIPFAESVVVYPVSRQTYTMSIAPLEGQVQGDDSIEARTSDGQKVLIDASVIFQVDPTKVIDVHINWQDRYNNDLVRAISRGVIRDAVSQYGVEEVYSSKRDAMAAEVEQELFIKFEENGLVLIDFVLRNISFSDEYAASVEQKQIAEQQAQQAQFVVEQRRQEAEQARQVAAGSADAAVIEAQGRADARIIEAQAEAEALELIADVLRKSDELLTYEYISKLSPQIKVMLLPSNAPFILDIPEDMQSALSE